MRRVLIALVDFYRRFISPGLPPACRYEPTCSAYAREALQVHGALKGSLLAIWRIRNANYQCKTAPSDNWRHLQRRQRST